MASQALLDVAAKERSKEALLSEMETRQQGSLVTDTFLLVALVVRDRVGRIQAPTDRLWDALMRYKDLQIFVFSSLGILCSVSMGTVVWYGSKSFAERFDAPLSTIQATDPTRFAAVWLLQVALTMSTVVCCVLLYQKYQLYVDEKRRKWSGWDRKTLTSLLHEATPERQKELLALYERSYRFYEGRLRLWFLMEVLIHAIHPFAMLAEPQTRSVFRVLEVVIFLRLYLLAKLLFVFSRAYRERVEILSSNAELRRSGSRITLAATLKMMYFTYPMLFSLVTMLLALVVLGFVIFVAERSPQPSSTSFGSIENSYWFAFVTFTSLGYGDLVPASSFGRLVAVVISATGIVMITVFTGVITNVMVQSREQQFVTEYLNVSSSSRSVRHCAAAVIQAAWRHAMTRRGDFGLPWLKNKHKSNVVLLTIKAFRRSRWSLTQSLSTASDSVVDTGINGVHGTLSKMYAQFEKHERRTTASIDAFHQTTLDLLQLLGAARPN